jgi:hypothetical protein
MIEEDIEEDVFDRQSLETLHIHRIMSSYVHIFQNGTV